MKDTAHRKLMIAAIIILAPILNACNKCEDNPQRLEAITFQGMPALQRILPLEATDIIRYVTNTGRVVEFSKRNQDSDIRLDKNNRMYSGTCGQFMSSNSVDTSQFIIDTENFEKTFTTKDSAYSTWSIKMLCNSAPGINELMPIYIDTVVQPVLFTNRIALSRNELPYTTYSILSSYDVDIPFSCEFTYMNGAKINVAQHRIIDSGFTLRELTNTRIEYPNKYSIGRYNSIPSINISGRNVTDCYMVEEISPTKPAKSPKSVVVSQRYGIVRIEWDDGRTLTRQWQ